MSEKYKELLEQYDIKVLSTFRSRGTFQCETEQGLALLKEYHGSLQKLALEYEWKEKLAEARKEKAEYAKKDGQLTMQVDWLKKKSEEICGPDYESKFSPKPFDE